MTLPTRRCAAILALLAAVLAAGAVRSALVLDGLLVIAFVVDARRGGRWRLAARRQGWNDVRAAAGWLSAHPDRTATIYTDLGGAAVLAELPGLRERARVVLSPLPKDSPRELADERARKIAEFAARGLRCDE